MSEKSVEILNKDLAGYFLPANSLMISLIGIFTALNFVATSFLQIPVPATGGYINVGDITVMFTALLFGPIIGGICGGMGPMLADLFLGYYIYAPATVVIKGLEGFLIGLIANPKKRNGRVNIYDIVAVIFGGLLIPFGYFIYEAYILALGVPVAVVEMPGNFIQFGIAAISSVLLITASRKNIIEGFPQAFNKVFIIESS